MDFLYKGITSISNNNAAKHLNYKYYDKNTGKHFNDYMSKNYF